MVNRDYGTMRAVLATIAGSTGTARYGDFFRINDEVALKRELARLKADGLIESTLEFQDGDGICLGGDVSGMTPEGREFFRLIENDRVWSIVSKTLDAAGIDVPYPLLKEVSEEIVKRYVMGFIPEM
nr:MAG TPA: Flagellin, PadR, transcription factor, DNA.8A [Caudoviricetes sp.]